MLSNKLAISTPSLGRHSSHKLDEKIILAAGNGFVGIEIVYNELELYANSQGTSIVEGAQKIKKLCDKFSIQVLSLAPFENFEGSISPLSDRLDLAKQWINIARTLGARYLQVPAQYDRTSSGIQQVIVSDLQKLADLASEVSPIISIAYEPMSWSVHVATWEAAWHVVEQVDRANFGLCLDSFHVLTKIWGNAFDPSGKYPDAEQALQRSLDEFKQFPLDKLFYVQLSDAERFSTPFTSEHPWYVPGETAEFTWSKHSRPFPLETELGGYLPVASFLKACVVDTGFKGWISFEIFDRRMQAESYKPADAVTRAKVSWKKLNAELMDPQAKL